MPITFNVLSWGKETLDWSGVGHRERKGTTGRRGKEFEKIVQTDCCSLSPLYKCFSNWNLKDYKSQRHGKNRAQRL